VIKFAAIYLRVGESRLFQSIGPMKDVRRPDGWTVHIKLGDAIAVTHRRWEQNLAPEESKEHFEVQWELRTSFDKYATGVVLCSNHPCVREIQ